ncbi:hypothetical protein QDR37_14590 [Amnibacterium sp. CER49]|uniref:hypothetical protein n=1 Tax=Amnibacterium sp. CER49 TaxID=3039161 RepID=UPI0024489CB8|nr:hypothetical protein [Amnibacterium sp. CER49]MDH2445178.1 hypothetical protein [Amnibacterium sp. CER49]
MFPRRPRPTEAARTTPFRALPVPGRDDPVRAFAYEALRTAPALCVVQLPVGLDDAVAALSRAARDFGRSGIRWSGAGVLRSSGLQWFGFDSGRSSIVAVPQAPGADGAADERFQALVRALAAGPWRTVVLTEASPELHDALEAARAVPAWEVAGLAHLAPGASSPGGAATLAA